MNNLICKGILYGFHNEMQSILNKIGVLLNHLNDCFLDENNAASTEFKARSNQLEFSLHLSLVNDGLKRLHTR